MLRSITSFWTYPTNETKKEDPKQEEYNKRVAEYKKNTEGLSSLFKHILYVTDNNVASAKSIAKILQAMGSSHPTLKGDAISAFNYGHSGNCTFFKDTPLGPSLHMGTTRIYNADGSVNQDRLKKLIETAAEKITDPVTQKPKEVITLSSMTLYLAQCTAEDPEQKDTGRYVSSVPFSKKIQAEAASAAWGEVFDRLACGWKSEKESYIDVDIIKEFFEDSPLSYLRAECGLLPAPKPVAPQWSLCAVQ